MIRVGFVLSLSDGWMGGINYFRNLLSAVHSLTDRIVEPIIFTGCNTKIEKFNDFPPVEIIRSRIFDRHSLPWFARKAYYSLFDHDLLLQQLFVKHGIEVFSHSGLHSASLGSHSRIPSIGWIPDLQHRRMPGFFSDLELKQRDRDFGKICTCCDRVIVSSFDAQADLAVFNPTGAQRSKVLQFVPEVNARADCASWEDVQKKYSINSIYFSLPNQFWTHKNHLLVVKALKKLKDQGVNALVLATGSVADYRQQSHFRSFMAYVEECGVSEEFRVLGVVPYSDLVALMKYSIAVINPSFFEGWSTSVEESKALGKTVVLSDIPVHREQSPERSVYFNPNDPDELAIVMKQLLDSWRLDEEDNWMIKARIDLPIRREGFARNYQQIVSDLLYSKKQML